MRTDEIRHNRSQSLSIGRRGKLHSSGCRTEYLARAYACDDMALSAQDAADRCALRAMSVLWQALAQRAAAKQS